MLTKKTAKNQLTLPKEIANMFPGVCRESSGDMFLSVVVSAGASYIVTGDKDLLALGAFRSIRMVTPQTLFASIRCPGVLLAASRDNRNPADSLCQATCRHSVPH